MYSSISNNPYIVRSILAPESDWDFLDYVGTLERQWQEKLRVALPKNEGGWLEIFPEAKQIVLKKIKEWEAVAMSARVQVKGVLCAIEATSSPEHRCFWRAVLKHTSPDVRELAIASRHIKRLRWLLPSKGKHNGAWRDALAQAREHDLVAVAEYY